MAEAGVDVVRRRGDAAALGVGLLVFVTSAWLIFLTDLPSNEAQVFRRVNELADALSQPMQGVNQLGTLWFVAVVWVVCLVLQAWRAAADVAATYILTRLLTGAMKEWVGRGRPADELADVVLRGPIPGGFGFPSAHTATIAGVATALVPHLPRRWRWVPWVAVALVAVGRVYVGAHLPLDVIGGAALGIAVGSLVHLLLGVPAPREPIAVDAGRLSA